MRSTLARRLVGCALILVQAQIASAQWMSLADSTATPVVVESAVISTEITGQFAVTTFDLVFRNPNGRQLEGTFEFPLLDGQVVTRFALDISGVLRDAVPVAKDRGRVVFEEIERRRVDPGLLEQTAGNNYRARIFPLPPLGTRHIVIAYQEWLVRDANAEATFRLALSFPQKLKRFALSASLHAPGATAPKVRSTFPFSLPTWRDARVFAVDQHDVQPTGIFELTLPRIASLAFTTQRFGGREYFHAEVPLPQCAPVARPIPGVIGLLWDASGSGRDRDHAKEFELLDRWFSSVQDVEVRLIELRDVAAPPASFLVKGGNWSGLRRALKRVVYDGATSFSGIVDDPAVQEWILFSDGLVNYGSGGGDAGLSLSAPIHTIVASARADTARLRGIAMRHGGEHANLLESSADTAASRIRNVSLRIIDVTRDPEAVAEVFPVEQTPIIDGTLGVAGVIRGGPSIVRIRVGHSEADAIDVEVSIQPGAEVGQLAARAWAAAKINALEVDPDRNREDIRRTSEEFGIVSADTSLIVLETLEDYLRYAVAPPPELRPQWEARQMEVAVSRGKSRETHLDSVAAAFARRQRWWESGVYVNSRPATGGSASVARNQQGNAAAVGNSDETNASWPEGHEFAEGTEDEVIVLSPFEVSAEVGNSYAASNTVAGTRVRSTLRDVGSRSRRRASVDFDPALPGDERLKAWSGRSGYMERISMAAWADRYDVYLEERPDHVREPGFFLDVAEFFFEVDEQEIALRILSNLAELQLEDAALLRVLGRRLMQASRPSLALPLFERVLRIRGEDPQSRRDLALACAAAGQPQRAVDLLWEVVSTPWQGRFPDIELVALGELNAIAATCGASLDLSAIDERLRRNLEVGLRAVLTWDADNCDIDLWVDDPDGERAFYRHPYTRQGGLMSRDFTEGYGPEEFLLRNPKPGKYTVRINYFGDSRNTAMGPVTVQVRMIRGFGTPGQKEECMTVRLTTNQETVTVGTIEIPDVATAVAADDGSRARRRKGPHGF